MTKREAINRESWDAILKCGPWAMTREELTRYYTDKTGDTLDDVFEGPGWDITDGRQFVAIAILQGKIHNTQPGDKRQ